MVLLQMLLGFFIKYMIRVVMFFFPFYKIRLLGMFFYIYILLKHFKKLALFLPFEEIGKNIVLEDNLKP